ncbi:TPA: hypothetical protein ACHUC0_003060 [Escherichia coli]
MMKMKTGVVALSVMLCCSTPVMADLLSLPKLNDSTFGYGKSVDGAVSDKLFYTLGDLTVGHVQQHAEAGYGPGLEQRSDVRQL